MPLHEHYSVFLISMSQPNQPSPRRGKSRTIVGDKVNHKAKKAPVHSLYGEIDMSSPLLSAHTSRASRKHRKPSSFKWGGITVLIKLFRLSVKFIPIAGALAGAVYSYTYFFGSIPIVDAIKAELGFTVEKQEKQESRVSKMLEQTRGVVAANDSRVDLGNAIATGDVSTADAIESGEVTLAASPPKTESKPVIVQAARDAPPASSGVTDAIGGLLSAFTSDKAPANETTTYSSGSTTYSGGITIVEDTSATAPASSSAVSPEAVTVVHDANRSLSSKYHNIDYTNGPPASAELTHWAQSIRIGGVLPEYSPQVIVNNLRFRPGEIVDYALGVTFEGLAQNGSLIIFKERSGAYVAVAY